MRQIAAPGPVPPRPLARMASSVLLFCVACAATSAACTDIRDYTGTWSGAIEPNPSLREGFNASTSMTLTVTQIDRGALQGSVTIGPSQLATAGFTDATLIPMAPAHADALGDLQFDGDPIATYLFSIVPDDPAEEHATVLISAHEGRRIEVRVIRYDLYGVFLLKQ